MVALITQRSCPDGTDHMISGESVAMCSETANQSKTTALLSKECDAGTKYNRPDQLRSQALQITEATGERAKRVGLE